MIKKSYLYIIRVFRIIGVRGKVKKFKMGRIFDSRELFIGKNLIKHMNDKNILNATETMKQASLSIFVGDEAQRDGIV